MDRSECEVRGEVARLKRRIDKLQKEVEVLANRSKRAGKQRLVLHRMIRELQSSRPSLMVWPDMEDVE